MSAWNVGEIEQMALHPVTRSFNFMWLTAHSPRQLYQRSADIFLEFHLTSPLAPLTMMVAQVCNLKIGEFIHTLGDAHIYSNHFEQIDLQLSREPRPLPKMKINPEVNSIFDFKFEDFELENYDPHPHIKGKVAI